MEVNVGDQNNRLIDVEQDIDRLQLYNRTANEFVGQRLTKLGNRVQATEEDLRSTQGRVDAVGDTMKAMTLTLRGITETQEQIQRGWGGMLERLEHLPRNITNAVDTWASIHMRGNQAETQTVTEDQLHGTTSTWFGSITMPSQLPERHTPPRPTASQHTMSTDSSPNKLFRDYVHSAEYGQEVLQDGEISQQSMPEGLRESTAGLSEQSGSGPSVKEDVVSMEAEELPPPTAGQSDPNRATLLVENEELMQEVVREPVEGGEVMKEDEVSKEGETLPQTVGQSQQSGTQSSLEPMNVNIGVSPPCPVEAVASTSVATHAEAGEVGEGEQSAAGVGPTAPPLSSTNVSVGSSFNPAPPVTFSPTIIPPTPTSSVIATGNTLEIPHRSLGWRSPSSASPPLTRSRSRSRTPIPPSARPLNEKQVRKR